MVKLKEFWIDKDECTGCGMCANVCPTNAINIIEDEVGFYYPIVSKKCIDCNKCEKACLKRIELKRENSFSPTVYAAWSNNQELRFSSTSGGIFSELAKTVIGEGGYVVGAEYDENNVVRHILISEQKQLYKLKQSKYVQSFSGEIYTCVKNVLEKDKPVLFCGTPCQISALNAFLGHNYPNLYTVDFICKGVNSPKAFRAWLEELEDKQNAKVLRVWFKYKEDGWKKSPKCTRIDFDDNSNVVLKQDDNLFMYGYLNFNLFIRPSCGQCQFKKEKMCSDITLADYWGIEKKFDDDKGTSLVAINTPKGVALFDKVKSHITYHLQSNNNAFLHNPSYLQSVTISPKSEKFLLSLSKNRFSKSLKRYTSSKGPLELMRRIKRKLKQKAI